MLKIGAGNDTINDSDGRGQINIGSATAGQGSLAALKISDNVWESVDKTLVYTLGNPSAATTPSGAATPGTTLLIGQRTSAGSNSVNATITIQNWQEGQLGINLGTNVRAEVQNKLYLGDQHAPIVTRTINMPGGQSQTLQVYDWDATSWAADGSLSGGIAEADFNDVITGSAGADTIKGLGGNDALSGGAGNDTIEGGEGDDLIAGGAGSDVISGGAGNDIIYSGNDLSVPNRLSPDDRFMDKNLGGVPLGCCAKRLRHSLMAEYRKSRLPQPLGAAAKRVRLAS